MREGALRLNNLGYSNTVNTSKDEENGDKGQNSMLQFSSQVRLIGLGGTKLYCLIPSRIVITSFYV